MSQENVAIVRSLVEPFAGINVADVDWGAEVIRDAVRNVHTPDVELVTLASGLGTGVGTHYRGLDDMVRYLGEWLEPFSEYHVENRDYIDAGDCVLVPSRQWGVGAASGAHVEIELTTLYELRDGRIARIHQYDTLEEARDAAAAQDSR
jgi:ketosteroid isomerase-like protein